MNTQLLDQLNITLRNILDAYERLGRGSVSLKRSAEQVAERIAVECNVQVRNGTQHAPARPSELIPTDKNLNPLGTRS